MKNEAKKEEITVFTVHEQIKIKLLEIKNFEREKRHCPMFISFYLRSGRRKYPFKDLLVVVFWA